MPIVGAKTVDTQDLEFRKEKDPIEREERTEEGRKNLKTGGQRGSEEKASLAYGLSVVSGGSLPARRVNAPQEEKGARIDADQRGKMIKERRRKREVSIGALFL